MFLANLSIIGAIGSSTGNVYKLLMEMQAIAPALHVVTLNLNLETDLPPRKALNRVNRAKTKDLRSSLMGNTDRAWPIDKLPIVLQDIKFTYKIELDHDGASYKNAGQLTFNQGELIALVGRGGEGKSTLLKLLGGVLLAEPGQVYVPSSLRLLHVSHESLFFKGSLYANLALGINRGSPDEQNLEERMLKICACLGMPPHVTDFIKEGHDGAVHPWASVLASSEQACIGIARAVIANPELLCIHKPLSGQPDERAHSIMELLRRLVDEKGVFMDPLQRSQRRPRTCLLTKDLHGLSAAVKEKSAEHIDSVYTVTHMHGTRRLTAEEVAAEFGG
jgi:ABC-type multidrug transport system fused ATPase/permease subunit